MYLESNSGFFYTYNENNQYLGALLERVSRVRLSRVVDENSAGVKISTEILCMKKDVFMHNNS